VRGYCRGFFEVKTSWNGEVLGRIPVDFSNIWTEYSADIPIPDGIQALYFTYRAQEVHISGLLPCVRNNLVLKGIQDFFISCIPASGGFSIFISDTFTDSLYRFANYKLTRYFNDFPDSGS